MQVFFDTEHENKFKELLKKANIKKDIGKESLFYIISGNEELYSNINKIYDFNKNKIIIKINDDGEIIMPDLSISSGATKLAYLGLQLCNNSNKQSIINTFSRLDSKNLKLAINAINLIFRESEKTH